MAEREQDDHVRLYIPGPIEVSAATFAAMASPMIGHRSADFQALYGDVQPGLRELFGTSGHVFVSTSSAWGVMEGALRNVVGKRVLCCCCGAFSDKWLEVARRCGMEADELRVEWGEPVLPEALDEQLSAGHFDAVTLVHNETSTGVMNPLPELAEVLRRHPEVISIVDTVSSFSAVPTPFDELGIDVMLTGTQKALALPPGMALFAVSERAFQRADQMPGRGYYFDFLEFRANAEKNMTPSTPVIPHIYALRSKVREILEEGLSARYERHERLNGIVADWVRARGFEFFAPEGFRSRTLTCVANNRGIDVAALLKVLRENHRIAIDSGYGKLKGKTMRISNMGDESEASIRGVLDAIDDSLARI